MREFLEEISGEYGSLMHVSISEQDGKPLMLPEFINNLELLVESQKDSDFLINKIPLTKSQLKTLVRNHTKEYQDRTSNQIFDSGFYMHFFADINAQNDKEKEQMIEFGSYLYKIWSAFGFGFTKYKEEITKNPNIGEAELNKAVSKLTNFIETKWQKLLNAAGGSDEVKLLLWRLVEGIAKGEIEVAHLEQDLRHYYYIYFTVPENFRLNRTNPLRMPILKKLKERIGLKGTEKPTLENLLDSDSELNSVVKTEFIKIGLNITNTLLSDTTILELIERDAIDEYFNAMEKFFTFYSENTESTDIQKKFLKYLNEKYLPYLKNYSKNLKKAALKFPFAADLLLEAFLIRTRFIDGVHEPSLFRILDQWEKFTNGKFSLIRTASKPNLPIVNGRSDQTLYGISVIKDKTAAVVNGDANFGQKNPETDRPSNKTRFGIPVFTLPSAPKVQPSSSTETTEALVDQMPGVDFEAGRAELLEWADTPVDVKSEEIKLLQKASPPPAPVNAPDKPKVRAQKRFSGRDMWIPAITENDTKMPAPISRPNVGPIAFAHTVSVNVSQAAMMQKEETPECQKVQTFKPVGEEQLKSIIYEKIDEAKLAYPQTNELITRLIDIWLNLNKPLSADKQVNIRRYFITKCCSSLDYERVKIFLEKISPYVENPQDSSIPKDIILPNSENISSYYQLPDIKKFPLLSEHFSVDDPTLDGIKKYIQDVIYKLKTFKYYYESLARITLGEKDDTEELALYYESLKTESDSMIVLIKEMQKRLLKGLPGNFLQRSFGNKKLKEEISKYFTDLSNHIEWIWQTGIEPSMKMFSKLILGKNKRQIPIRREKVPR